MAKRDKEQENKQVTETAAREKQRREGAAALDQARADEAAKTEEQKAADEQLAREQQEATAKEEAERAAAEQKAAEEELARVQQESAKAEVELSADTRILKAGTIVHLNGEPGVLPVDAPVVIAGAASEQHFASILARDPSNFALNADRLRLVYNPMNGTPLPLSAQRLAPEEMTEQERAVFGEGGGIAPPVKRAAVPKGSLPPSLPGHDTLHAAGINTYGQLLKQRDSEEGLEGIPDIGPSTAAKIADRLANPSDE